MRLLNFIHCRLRNVFPTSIASILCLYVLLLLTYASTTHSITHQDHNHHRLLELQSEVYGTSDHGSELEVGGYESEFLGADRSIIGRADAPHTLANNYPGKDNIEYGGTQFWKFPGSAPKWKTSRDFSARSSLAERDAPDSAYTADITEDGSLRRRQIGTTLYITLNICDQPQAKVANPNGAPAPLQLYISTHSSNQRPSQDNSDIAVPVAYGYGFWNLTISGDVYLSVTAPVKSSQFDGKYSYELTGSVDKYYTAYIDESPKMALVDSDTNAALLSSEDGTDTSKYGVFVHPQADPTILGLSSSFCGLRNWARIKGNIDDLSTGDVDTGVMKLGPVGTRQLFYAKNLNSSSAYYGILTLNGSSTDAKVGEGIPGGGGTVWSTRSFTTKASGNCAVIYNLSFCSDVAYAVPSNTTQTNRTALAQLYDNDAQTKYQNFNKSLQQIPCDTTSSAQYSLARTCTDCANDYKTWLCAVTIPRCEDFSNNAPFLMHRLLNQTFSNGTTPSGIDQAPYTADNKSTLYMNSSRNRMIDEIIKPGPYKEVLPCTDICYDIVRSCPASLGFACPLKNHGLKNAYGENGTGTDPVIWDPVTCNYPGAPFKQSSASGLKWSFWVVGVAFSVAMVNGVWGCLM